MGEFPRRVAGDAGVHDVKTALTILIVMAVTGCSNLPKDGRYQTGGGGWDNFRAEARALTVFS